MAYIIGIDTGGTYTDAVLLDTDKKKSAAVIRKAKSFTTREELEKGIGESIEKLRLTSEDIRKVEKVILSTTLATNAIVEGKIHDVGLVAIGDLPGGELAAKCVKLIRGKVNIKGRVLLDIDKYEVVSAVNSIKDNVDSIAVSCVASVRNPVLEQKVKGIISSICDLPVVCGYELARDLGFLERTNTAIINAGLLSIINTFMNAVKKVLNRAGIEAPVFVVKGDGTVSKGDIIRNTPINTALSGPAASIIGAINLTGEENAIVADMGGTTTDTGVVRNRRVELSPDGASIGGWKIKVKSAKLYTFGLGGDSSIRIEDSEYKIGPERILPACRGGNRGITPTDILHCSRELDLWERERALQRATKEARGAGISITEYIEGAKAEVAKKINDNLSQYKITRLPVIAIGAPAKAWYKITSDKYAVDFIIPEHYEVANAVGAATAGICAVGEAVVRPGEDGGGYLVHADTERFSFNDMTTAFEKAFDASRKYALQAVEEQELEVTGENYECSAVYQIDGDIICVKAVIENGNIVLNNVPAAAKFLEAKIKVFVSGNIFAQS